MVTLYYANSIAMEIARPRFEREVLARSGKERFASDPWDVRRNRYKDATMQRNWSWFLAGHCAMQETVRSI